MNLFPGQQIERYRVLRRVGIGGMASVYLVRHNQLKTLHALKVLNVPRPSVVRRLVREGQLQGRLRHPNVVPVSDIVEIRGTLALVMEYVAGPSLDQLLQRGRLPLTEVDLLARGLLAAVEAAHGAGIVHRDIKPSNVLLSTEDPTRLLPRITDFGLAKALTADLDQSTLSGAMLGTPAYMAPEQIRDASLADHRADVWSLGALLFELVTGERAFRGPDVYAIFDDIVQGRVPDIQEAAPDLDPAMQRAIERALVVDLEARTPSVQALLEQWCTGRPEPAQQWSRSTLEQARGLVIDAEELPPDEDSASITYHLGDVATPEPPPPDPEPASGRGLSMALGLALLAGSAALTAFSSMTTSPRTSPTVQEPVLREVDSLGVRWRFESPQPSEALDSPPRGPHAHFWLDPSGRTQRIEWRNAAGAPLPADTSLRFGFQNNNSLPSSLVVHRDDTGRVSQLEHRTAHGRLEQVIEVEWLDDQHLLRTMRSPHGGPIAGTLGAPVERRTLDAEGRVIETRLESAAGQPMPNDDGIWGLVLERTPDGHIASRTWLDATGAPAPDGLGVVKTVYRRHPETHLVLAKERYGFADLPVSSNMGCHISRFDHVDGSVVAEHCEDATGRRTPSRFNHGCATRSLVRRDGSASLLCLDEEGHPLASIEGPARWEYDLDERGYATEVRTFDETGAAWEDERGVHRSGSTLDPRGAQRVEGPFFRADGTPISAGSYDAHFVTMERDQGALQVVVRHDERGQPGASGADQSWVIQRISLDETGAPMQRTYYDEASRPVLAEGRYHEVRISYDAFGFLRRRELRGLTGELVAAYGPVAVLETTFDPLGHEVGRAYLGTDGQPVAIGGVARWRHTYDDKGRQIRTEALGVDDEPVLDEEGVAVYEAGYDPLGLLVDQRYLDTAGQPVRSSTRGHYRRERTYDQRGNLLEERYLGVDGQPVTSGCARRVRDLDDAGVVREERCLDASGAPTDLPGWLQD